MIKVLLIIIFTSLAIFMAGLWLNFATYNNEKPKKISNE
jgi:hypothetical protein